MRSSTDLNALSSLLVEKKLEIPWVHNPDIVALTRHIKELPFLNMKGKLE